MYNLKNIIRKFSGVAGLCLFIGITSTNAANLTVSTTADAGPGSLREALTTATSNGEAANIVTFILNTGDPGYDAGTQRYTFTLAGPLPSIPLAPLTLTSDPLQRVTIKANGPFRVFTLVDSAVLIINNMTISGGFADNGLGGGFYMGDSSILTLNRCTVSNNFASGKGGGVYMSDSATLNTNQTTIAENTSLDGGGIFINNSGTLNMSTSTLSSNTALAGGSGGAIYNNTSGTINGNSNTIDGNSAGVFGGGIYSSATITMTNNTITANVANRGGGVYNALSGTGTLQNNLVALNTASGGGPDLFGGTVLGGTAFTGSYNLIGNADGSVGVGGAPNRAGTTGLPIDPLLGPLRNNGGPTRTRELLVGSPAIDKGQSATLVFDQRGSDRPKDDLMIPNDGGNAADMGAFEYQLAPTAANVAISGRIIVAYGKYSSGLSRAVITLTDTNGEIRTAISSSMGYYRFEDVPVGTTYVATVHTKQYQFDTQVITPSDELTDLDFVGYGQPQSLRSKR